VPGIRYLAEAYEAREPGRPGGTSGPAVVGVPTGRLVTDACQRLTRDRAAEWRDLHREGAPGLCPEAPRDEIDEVMAEVYENVSNGVYRAVFGTVLDGYAAAREGVSGRLELLSRRLTDRRNLAGATIAEADIRLSATLVRFDAVHHGHFPRSRRKVTEDPVRWACARDPRRTPGFGDAVGLDPVKRHRHQVHEGTDPSRIVPLGPDPSGWLTPHGRESPGGRPFGDGTPPGPVREGEEVPAEGRP